MELAELRTRHRTVITVPPKARRGITHYCGRYAELAEEVRAADDVARWRATGKKRREGTVRFKSGAGGTREAEARLDSKAHRRVSRRSRKQGLADELGSEPGF